MLRLSCFALTAILFFGNALAESGGSTSAASLLSLVRQAWAPPSLNADRWRATSISAAQLKALGAPVAALRVSTAPIIAATSDKIRELVQNELNKDGYGNHLRLRELSVKTQWQQILLKAGVTYADGTLSVEADMVGTVAVAMRGDELVLLPAIETAIVQKAELLHSGVDLGIEVPLANAALSQAIRGINAGFASGQLVKPIPIAMKPFEKIDLAAQLGKITGVTEASGPTIDPTVHLENAVVLIDAAHIEIVSGLAAGASLPLSANPPADVGAPPPDEQIATTYQAFTHDFHTARDMVASPPDDAALWVAIKSSFLSDLVQRLVGQPNPPACATYNASVPVPFATRIRSFNGALPDCTPAMRCDPHVDTRDCRRPSSCSHDHDTRECSKCVVSVFGHCKVRGNDPGCETAKAAQNVIYDSNYSACINSGWIVDKACETAKATQNVIYDQQKLACEAAKTVEKGKCEALKELQKQVQDLADISGQMQISGPAHVCIAGISASPRLDTLELRASLDALLSVSGSIHYIPLNIPGSILGCPTEWTKSFTAHVNAAPDTHSFSARVTPEQHGDTLDLKVDAGDVTLRAEMHPPPLEAIFGQHPELAVECPILFGAGGTAQLVNAASVAASGNDLVPELRGHFSHMVTIPVQELQVLPQVIPLGATGRLVAAPHLQADAVTFTGSLQAP